MSKIAKAETALVSKLDAARSQIIKSNPSPPRRKEVGGISKPKPFVIDPEDGARTVQNLEVPAFDKSRTFKGIERQKIDKKDRHLKALEGFSKTLESVAEEIEQDLLSLSRAVREDIENIDIELKAATDLLRKDDYLVQRSSEDLDASLVSLKAITTRRSQTIENFKSDLERMECRRADTVGAKIKLLVDDLISIAHKLPDDIEHIVETEAFDLNTVLTRNRQSHAELLGVMRTKQIEVAVRTLHEWDVAKKRWRLLRHQKAIGIFHTDIQGSAYTEPADRQQYMAEFRDQQLERNVCRKEALCDLAKLDAHNITSKETGRVKEVLSSLNDEELAATQTCYNGLSDLRARLRGTAEQRMEVLRKELHVYGALHDEPPLQEIATDLRAALADSALSELWRLGGGLKSETTAVATEICSEDMVYDHLVSTVASRLEVILCGFSLKEVLNERGRLPRLEAVKLLLSKLRTVPRNEVAGVLASLLPDLKEMSSLEKMPATFQVNLSHCVEGIENELERLAQYEEMGGGTVGGGRTTIDAGSTAGKSRRTARSRGGTAADTVDKSLYPDPFLVKQWTKILGMLYYASDLPEAVQGVLTDAMNATREQRICNTHVDVVVKEECDYELDRLDSRYKRLIDSIATFLELQTGALAYSSNQVSDFYNKIAKIVEDHKKKQADLDEASLDLLWDMKEENRLAKEDRENEFQDACNALRRSADMNELQKNFESVLDKLSHILDSYRAYHGDACFNADKHPISLADDYVEHMNTVCELFLMEPVEPHIILDTQRRLHESNARLNRKYLQHDEGTSASVEAVPVEEGAETVEAEAAREAIESAEPAEEEFKSRPASKSATTNSEVVKQYVDIFFIPEIIPVTNLEEEPEFDDDGNEVEKDRGVGRKYGLKTDFDDYVKTFVDETGHEEEEEGEGARSTNIDETESVDGEDDDSGGVIQKVRDRVNPEYPWIVMKSYPGIEDGDMVTLLSAEALEKMDADEVAAYEDSIEKYFVERDPSVPFSVMKRPDTGENDEDDLVQEGENKMVEDVGATKRLKEAYETTKQIVARARRRREMRSPKYLRENAPLDSAGNPFALMVEIEFDVVKTMLFDLRASLVSHLESTSLERIEQAEIQCKKRKDDLTDELEDLLRTHWPRCGLVETQIKRPREVELLNHEEKTYRFILSIQEKMSALQCKFDDEVIVAGSCCDKYFENIQELVYQLTSVQFKTLASLQGVEVKARVLTQTFSAAGNNHLTSLQKMVAEDASSIIVYARDFRKICPPQEEGKDGGYSPDELEEIAHLVEGQCAEISEVLEGWMSTIHELEQKFAATAAEHGSFTNKYDQVANELALSQGLGQKYGAPRRRAQERLRTEMSRDEQSAGKVDELLALLEFSCSEAVRNFEHFQSTLGSSSSLLASLVQGKDATLSKHIKECGYEELRVVENMWLLSLQVRKSLHDRAKYLVVLEEGVDENLQDIEWPAILSRFPPLPEQSRPKTAELAAITVIPITCLQDVVSEVEQVCIQETKELYAKEGKADMLKDKDQGIPESLATWLKETRHKILGPKGHREKSWKRLWGQVDKFELLLARKAGPLDQPQTKVGVPAACFRTLSSGYQLFLSLLVDRKVDQFEKLLKIWEMSKQKHERLLRPRLGSPDALDELLNLDAIENERSNELRQHVQKFQSSLLMETSKYSKIFCEDLGACATAFVKLVDSSLRLELLLVPPDTEIPKKKVTLKRLRKAQRVQAAVKSGSEDLSVERLWPGLGMAELVNGMCA